MIRANQTYQRVVSKAQQSKAPPVFRLAKLEVEGGALQKKSRPPVFRLAKFDVEGGALQKVAGLAQVLLTAAFDSNNEIHLDGVGA